MRELAVCPGAGLCGGGKLLVNYCELVNYFIHAPYNSNRSSFPAHTYRLIISIPQAIALHA